MGMIQNAACPTIPVESQTRVVGAGFSLDRAKTMLIRAADENHTGAFETDIIDVFGASRVAFIRRHNHTLEEDSPDTSDAESYTSCAMGDLWRYSVEFRLSSELLDELGETWQKQVQDVQDMHADAYVSFLAKASHRASVFRATICCNNSLLVAELELNHTYQMFHLRLPMTEPVWSFSLMWNILGPDGDAETPRLDAPEGVSTSSTPFIQIDQTFGIRIQNRDLLQTLRLQHGDSIHLLKDSVGEKVVSAVADADGARPDRGDAYKDDLFIRSSNRSCDHEVCRKGKLTEMGPARYILEASVELIVHGLTGLETMDVYVNGASIPCQLGIELPLAGGIHLRYLLAPLDCAIRSVMLRVCLTGVLETNGDTVLIEDGKSLAIGSCGGVVIDPEFGVMVQGRDCLESVAYVDGTSGVENPAGWVWDDPRWVAIRNGLLTQSGWYKMRPHWFLPKLQKRKSSGRVGLNFQALNDPPVLPETFAKVDS